jgi:hypothetical protein
LTLAYLALAAGLLAAGAALIWLGLRRPPRPSGTPFRLAIVVAFLLAAAGLAAAVLLEARAARPW